MYKRIQNGLQIKTNGFAFVVSFLIAVESFNLLMRKSTELGMFSGFKFDVGDECFSHLQYVDDILIIAGRMGKHSNYKGKYALN